MRQEKEILDLLELKRPIIWINTIEEGDFIRELLKTLDYKYTARDIYTWSISSPLIKIDDSGTQKVVTNSPSLDPALGLIRKEIDEHKRDRYKKSIDVYIIKDAHMIMDKPNAIRAIRDLCEQPNPVANYYYPLIMISPVIEIPKELEQLITVVNYSTPSKNEIKVMLDTISSKMISKGKKPLTPAFATKAIDNLNGLTAMDIRKIIAESLKKEKELKMEYITKAKIDALKNTGLLDYKIPTNSINDVGGNDNFKSWIEEVKACMTKEARDFGLAEPKGYLALGLPGTSKTFMAEALAKELDVPFITLDMSKIMHKHVGQSERNMSRALELVESCSPCVLLIDEVEKALSGLQSQGKSDGGTLARTFGSILQFLNKENGVFTVMTSNDVSQLPPELTRAGRLDAIWYFGLPTKEERIQIFKVHLSKKNQTIEDDELNEIVEMTDKYTGAEIEQIVKFAHIKAFLNKTKNLGEGKITIAELKEAVELVVPISKSSKEKIDALEIWSRGRALYANRNNIKEEHEIQIDEWEFV